MNEAITAPVKNDPTAQAPALDSSHIAPQVVVWVKRSRFNPIRQLNPDYLARIIDTFYQGFLREFSLMMEAIKRRDDVICVALPKREKAIARHGFNILVNEGLDESEKDRAEQHREALEYFYQNCTATHILEQDQRGGFRLLVKQMMEAVGFRYAVHEIVWKPMIDPISGQPRLTAHFNYVPLWFFECTTGKLRFIKNYFGTIMGEDMAPDEWLVTVGEGIMEPLAIAYMFKIMSLKDWVSYSERFGTPGVIGKTAAPKDSPAWQQMEEAVAQFGQDFAAVLSQDGMIELIEAKAGSATLPFHPLVERMDRAIATICRGADLSTISSGKGSEGRGASMQQDESIILEQDDAEHMSETLTAVSRTVIRQLFGDELPLAYVQITVPERKNNTDIINKLTFLVNNAVAVGQEFARSELGVPPPGENEEVLKPIAQTLPEKDTVVPESERTSLANSGDPSADGRSILFMAHAREKYGQAIYETLSPILSRLGNLYQMTDPGKLAMAKAKLKADLPALYRRVMANSAASKALEEIIGTALASGSAEAAKAHKTT